MSRYYLMAQLPSLETINETTPLPITEERFYDLCDRFLGKKAARALRDVTLVPDRVPKASGFRMIDAWNEGERNLRLALGRVRAAKRKKPFEAEQESFSSELLQTVRTAVEMDDALAAERFLNQYRMRFLETLRPADSFSEEAAFYYGLKLKLILHMRQFDTEKGEAAYRNIYRSVLSEKK